MSLTYSVDPGTLQSALVVVRDGGPFGVEVLESKTILNGILISELMHATQPAELVIERFAALGMAIGEDSIETILWSGRFYEAWGDTSTRYWLTRRAVKLHLCGTLQSKDANVAAAVRDRFGGAASKGTKRAPGPLYGVKGHELQALAVAVTWLEMHPNGPQ
jgi:hypothetical protein